MGQGMSIEREDALEPFTIYLRRPRRPRGGADAFCAPITSMGFVVNPSEMGAVSHSESLEDLRRISKTHVFDARSNTFVDADCHEL